MKLKIAQQFREKKINFTAWLIESGNNLWKLKFDIFCGTTKTVCEN